MVPELSKFTPLLLIILLHSKVLLINLFAKWQLALFTIQPQRKQTYELPLLLHLRVTEHIQAQQEIISPLFCPGNQMPNPRLLHEMWLVLILLIRSLQDTEYSY